MYKLHPCLLSSHEFFLSFSLYQWHHPLSSIIPYWIPLPPATTIPKSKSWIWGFWIVSDIMLLEYFYTGSLPWYYAVQWITFQIPDSLRMSFSNYSFNHVPWPRFSEKWGCSVSEGRTRAMQGLLDHHRSLVAPVPSNSTGPRGGLHMPFQRL